MCGPSNNFITYLGHVKNIDAYDDDNEKSPTRTSVQNIESYRRYWVVNKNRFVSIFEIFFINQPANKQQRTVQQNNTRQEKKCHAMRWIKTMNQGRWYRLIVILGGQDELNIYVAAVSTVTGSTIRDCFSKPRRDFSVTRSWQQMMNAIRWIKQFAEKSFTYLFTYLQTAGET